MIAATLIMTTASARAFDLAETLDVFNWFGTRPVPRADTVPYAVTIVADADIDDPVREASLLQQSRDDPPRDGEELARRVEADLPRIVDAVWARGYYAAEVSIEVDGVPVRIGAVDPARLAAVAGRFRNVAVVPIVIRIVAGPLYRLRAPAVIDRQSALPFAPEILPERVVRLAEGDPAPTSSVLAAAARISDRFRERGHPFVKVVRRAPVIDHRTRSVDLVLTVDPGPVARLGPVAISGTRDVDRSVVRSFIYTEPGDPYSPAALAALRKSVGRIEALGAVKVVEGQALNGAGQLPLEVQVTERPPRLIGASARYSTVDGPALRTYWTHRNLFGGAERLRLEADLFYTTLDRDAGRSAELSDLGGRFAASFLKPALGGSRFDLLADLVVARERIEAYDADTANVTVALRRRFTDTFSAQAGIEGEAGRIERAPLPLIFGLGTQRERFDYGLAGLPLSVTYDSTDKPLDPTTGFRVTASAAPYLGFGDAAPVFGIGRVSASTYYAIDSEARTVIAARIGFGSIVGGSLAEIPATRLFFAGGGGSVRGYEYRTLSPSDAFGRLTGGRSLVEGSLEARIKLTDTIGIVPFVDAGQAFAGSLPDGSEKLRVAAGMGLRYYTGLGPIRLDVALPLNRRRGEDPYGVYVSIGQAF
jgi:translocation and assembly module TamA